MTEKQIANERRRLLERIRQHMEANNITQQEVADKCGFLQPSVNRMLNGDFGAKLDNIIAICAAIGLKLDVRDITYKQLPED